MCEYICSFDLLSYHSVGNTAVMLSLSNGWVIKKDWAINQLTHPYMLQTQHAFTFVSSSVIASPDRLLRWYVIRFYGLLYTYTKKATDYPINQGTP